MGRRQSWLAVAVLSLAACPGGDTLPGPMGAGAGFDNGGVRGGSVSPDASASADLAPAGLDLLPAPDLPAGCASPCAARAPYEAQGWCFVSDTDGFTDCTAWCAAHWSSLDAADRLAFEQCATTNPLCFESIESCIAGGGS